VAGAAAGVAAVMDVDAFGVATAVDVVGPLKTIASAAAATAAAPAPAATKAIGRPRRTQRPVGVQCSKGSLASADHAYCGAAGRAIVGSGCHAMVGAWGQVSVWLRSW
jgi:hypothetical protein